MKQSVKALQQLKGVGSILVRRFQDAGLDSFTKIAEADQEQLGMIKGINPRRIPAIQDQARLLAETAHSVHQETLDALVLRLAEVKGQVQDLAESARERFPDRVDSKCGRKLAKEMACIEDTLQRLNLKGKKGVRRCGKALDKVQKRVAALAGDAPLKKVRKTLKRARKAAQKAVK